MYKQKPAKIGEKFSEREGKGEGLRESEGQGRGWERFGIKKGPREREPNNVNAP